MIWQNNIKIRSLIIIICQSWIKIIYYDVADDPSSTINKKMMSLRIIRRR